MAITPTDSWVIIHTQKLRPYHRSKCKNKIVRSAKSERLCELHLQSLADDLKKLARQVYARTFTVMWHETQTCKVKYHLHLRDSEKNKDAARSASFLLLVKFCT